MATEVPKRRRRKRISLLTNIGQVATEIARVYRQFRYNEITGEDARVAVTCLLAARQCLESGSVEERMERLERAAAEVLARGSNVTPFKLIEGRKVC